VLENTLFTSVNFRIEAPHFQWISTGWMTGGSSTHFLGRNLRRPGFLPAARGSPERRLRRVARGPADVGHGGGARGEDHRTVAFRGSFRWILAEHWKFSL